MKKYRIVKIEDRQQTYFRIQKKFLFWWVGCSVQEKYFEYHGMALVSWRNFDYYSLEQAERILSKIKNPFEEIYKGNRIVRVFGSVVKDYVTHHLEDVYINKSNYGFWNGSLTYEWSETIEGLKTKIDNRTSKKKVTIIA